MISSFTHFSLFFDSCFKSRDTEILTYGVRPQRDSDDFYTCSPKVTTNRIHKADLQSIWEGWETGSNFFSRVYCKWKREISCILCFTFYHQAERNDRRARNKKSQPNVCQDLSRLLHRELSHTRLGDSRCCREASLKVLIGMKSSRYW